MPKRAVVLLSGGIDSATCLYLAKRKGFRTHCLIFDYGQRHRREISSAKKLAKTVGARFTVCRISLPWKGSSLIDKAVSVPKRSSGIASTYVPARNTIFLSFALSCAEAIKAKAVFIGANAVDFAGYPDCRGRFYRAFRKLIKAGAKFKDIQVYTPLIKKSKAQIIKLGKSLRLPFELTWSCYQGKDKPCGECSSCRFRAKGFREAGILDPLE